MKIMHLLVYDSCHRISDESILLGYRVAVTSSQDARAGSDHSLWRSVASGPNPLLKIIKAMAP